MTTKGAAAFLGAAALVAALWGIFLWNGRGEPGEALAAIAMNAREAPAALRREARRQVVRADLSAREADRAKAAAAADSASADMPKSLRGTDVDGALRVGPDGRLVLGPDVITFFDYFLSATGEESDAAIRARIEAAIRERLAGPAAEEAIALLNKYMAYRDAARTMRAPPGTEEDPGARLLAVKALRREQFGEDAASKLFGDEEREGAAAIERSRVLKDTSLSAEEREAKLQAIEATLPEEVQKARAEVTLPLTERAEEEAMRGAGATEADIRKKRVESVGEEGADRLEELDRQRAAWKKRVEAFRAERDKLAQGSLDEGARQAAEQRLLDETFTPEERLRVKAILAIPKE